MLGMMNGLWSDVVKIVEVKVKRPENVDSVLGPIRFKYNILDRDTFLPQDRFLTIDANHQVLDLYEEIFRRTTDGTYLGQQARLDRSLTGKLGFTYEQGTRVGGAELIYSEFVRTSDLLRELSQDLALQTVDLNDINKLMEAMAPGEDFITFASNVVVSLSKRLEEFDDQQKVLFSWFVFPGYAIDNPENDRSESGKKTRGVLLSAIAKVFNNSQAELLAAIESMTVSFARDLTRPDEIVRALASDIREDLRIQSNNVLDEDEGILSRSNQTDPFPAGRYVLRLDNPKIMGVLVSQGRTR